MKKKKLERSTLHRFFRLSNAVAPESRDYFIGCGTKETTKSIPGLFY